MPRSVEQIVASVRTFEGAGFPVRRPFPTPTLDHFDPFLLLDEMGPVKNEPGEAQGAPDHPHRGFETVTYLLEGAMQHRDSAGNSGRLNPGDVQWMTAGSGVVHSEMPSAEMLRDGGTLHGLQLWVNLPAAEKMKPPRYQDTPSARIPVVEEGGVWVKVIAGQSLGASAVIETHTPILYLHVRMKPGARLVQAVPSSYNLFAYVLSGRARFDAKREAEEGAAVFFRGDGDEVEITATSDAEFLLLGGEPINESVARYGPFVMNTREEIYQAFEDFRAGRMGRIGS